MRRWFVIFLLAVLPLQFSWGAVLTYCEHETDAQAQHLGHHQHSHASDVAAQAVFDVVSDVAPDGSADASAALSGMHCDHCHSSCCTVPALGKLPLRMALAPHPVAASDRITPTWAQTPPERPQWPPIA